jgi:signal transduction histidine kinase
LLIEKMGGKIGFVSEVDAGSTFWLDLPLASLDETMLDMRAGT